MGWLVAWIAVLGAYTTVLWYLHARSIRSLRADLLRVENRDTRGFDLLNQRITDEVGRLKERMINFVSNGASDTLWVKEVLEEMVARREHSLRLAIDREFDRCEREMGKSLDRIERHVADALTNAQTNIKIALRTEPPAAVEDQELGGRPAWVEMVDEKSRPPAFPEGKEVGGEPDYDMAYRAIGRCGQTRTWDGSMMRCEKMHPHSGQHEDERGDKWPDLAWVDEPYVDDGLGEQGEL